MTVTGFIVGLALSFRGTTGYERYNEGRRYWTQLTVTSHTLARLIWIHTKEREGDLAKKDLLAKMSVSSQHHTLDAYMVTEHVSNSSRHLQLL